MTYLTRLQRLKIVDGEWRAIRFPTQLEELAIRNVRFEQTNIAAVALKRLRFESERALSRKEVMRLPKTLCWISAFFSDCCLRYEVGEFFPSYGQGEVTSEPFHTRADCNAWNLYDPFDETCW